MNKNTHTKRESCDSISMFFCGRFLAAALLILISLLNPSSLHGQRVVFPPLLHPGAASIVLDEAAKEAYIIDGGQTGSLLERPLIDQEPVLDYLASQDYRTIYITCSHPHSDHQAGLLDLVRYKARRPGEVDLGHFERIVFIDSDYPSRLSLFEEFQSSHGQRPGVSRESASGRDAYAAARVGEHEPTSRAVKIWNYVYIPREKAGPHGHSVITHYTLSNPIGEQSTFVDFDDADTELVEMWAHEIIKARDTLHGKRYFVAPHHNSDTTNIDALLAKDIRPDGVIFQVNPRNRFFHPGPENWLKWIDAVGVERIYITGAGHRLDAGPDGLEPLTLQDLESVYDRIIAPMIERVEIAELEIKEQWGAASRVDLANLSRERRRSGLTQVELAAALAIPVNDLRAWEHGKQIPADMQEALAREIHNSRHRIQWERFEKRRSSLRDLERAYRSVSKSKQSAIVAEILGRGGTPRPGQPPPPPTAPLDLSPKRPKPAGPGGGTGAYADLNRQFENNFGGGSGSRGTRFDSSNTGSPVFGGIIIGNQVELKDNFYLESAKISRIEDDASDPTITPYPSLEIQLHILGPQGSEWAIYDNFTTSELWSAYHVVKPLAEWKRKYNVVDQDCNLIGIAPTDIEDESADPRWSFGIHPALANTSLAVEGMHLDMLVSILDLPFVGSSRAKAILDEIGGWETYQWYDAPSLVSIRRGVAFVEAQTDPAQPLLRLRFWKELASEDFISTSEEAGTRLAEILYYESRFVRRYDRLAKALAVLNLIADSDGVELPDFPQGVEPDWISVEPSLEVFAAVEESYNGPGFWTVLGVLGSIAIGGFILAVLGLLYSIRWWRNRRSALVS